MEKNPEISRISAASPHEHKDRLVELLLSVGIVRRYGSSNQLLIPLALRGRPVCWSQVIRGRVAAVLDGQRLGVSPTASVPAASFMKVMLNKCADTERMWGCAFAYDVDEPAAAPSSPPYKPPARVVHRHDLPWPHTLRRKCVSSPPPPPSPSSPSSFNQHPPPLVPLCLPLQPPRTASSKFSTRAKYPLHPPLPLQRKPARALDIGEGVKINCCAYRQDLSCEGTRTHALLAM